MDKPRDIQKLRARLSLTQEEFAHKLGVTVATVNRWERQRMKPSKLAQSALQRLYNDSKGLYP